MWNLSGPHKVKGNPGENFITEVVTTEAALDEMAGLDKALQEEASHHGMKPTAVCADAGYVTDPSMSETEARGDGAQGSYSSRSSSGAVQCRCFRSGYQQATGDLSPRKVQYSVEPYSGYLHGDKVLPD